MKIKASSDVCISTFPSNLRQWNYWMWNWVLIKTVIKKIIMFKFCYSISEYNRLPCEGTCVQLQDYSDAWSVSDPIKLLAMKHGFLPRILVPYLCIHAGWGNYFYVGPALGTRNVFGRSLRQNKTGNPWRILQKSVRMELMFSHKIGSIT